MPKFDVTLSDGTKIQLEADQQPTEAQVIDALKGLKEDTSTGGALARALATGVGPAAAATAAFGPSAEATTALLAPETGPLAPIGGVIGGGIGAGLAAAAAAWGQKKLLKAAVPDFASKLERLQATDVQQHPIATAVGSLAAQIPSAEISLPKTLFEAGKRVATQAGLTTGQTAISEGRLPTVPELAESAVGATLFGAPRSALMTKSAAAWHRVQSFRDQLRPAVKAMDGKVFIGEKGDSHNDIIDKNKLKAQDIDRRVFVDAQGREIPRELAAKLGMFPTTELHSSELAAAQTPGEEPSASSEQEAAEIHGDLFAQSQQGKRQVSTQERGAGVQPQAPAVAEQAQVPLEQKPKTISGPQRVGLQEMGFTESEIGTMTPEEAEAALAQRGEPDRTETEKPKVSEQEELLAELNADERAAKAAAQSRGQKVDFANGETKTENEPFAADNDTQIATITPGPDRRIIINRKAFNKWLMGIPMEQQAKAIESLVDEENIHLKTSAEDAASYWGALSKIEQAIVRKRYTGKWGKGPYNETQLGYEAIRGRIQQLAGMDPREVVEATGKYRWGNKLLVTLEKALQNIRRALGTSASAHQLEVLGRVSENLNIAKNAVDRGMNTPDAIRKDTPEGSAAEFGLRFKPAAGFKMEGVPPEMESQLRDIHNRSGWEFTDRRPGSATAGMTFYTPVGADRDTIIDRYQNTAAKFLGLPEVEPGKIRLYHGEGATEGAGAGQSWFTSDIERARSFGGRVSYIDVPKGVSEEGMKRANASGSGTYGDRLLPSKFTKYAQPVGDLGQPVHELPYAARKKGGPYDPDQLKMFDFGKLTAKGEAGKEVAKPEERAGAGFVAEPLPSLVQKNLDSDAPNFDDFMKVVKEQYGPRVQPDQVRNMYEDQMWRTLMTAPGEKITKMLGKMQLKGEILPPKAVEEGREVPTIPDAPKDMQEQIIKFIDELGKPVAGKRKPKVTETEETKEGQDMMADLLEAAGEGRRAEPVSKEELKTIRTKFEAAQRRRNKAISAIARRILSSVYPVEEKNLARDLTPEDVAYAQEITPLEVGSDKRLEQNLTENARRSGRDPMNHTKKLVALVDKKTGEVQLGDVYNHGREGLMFAGKQEPGVTGAHQKLSELLKKFRPIYSVTLEAPVKDYHRRFDSVDEFKNAFNIDEAVSRSRETEYSDFLKQYAGEDVQEKQDEEARRAERPATIVPEGENVPRGTTAKDVEELVGENLGLTQVTKGEGGSLQGPAAGEARGLMGLGKGIRLRASRAPVTPAEAMNVYDMLQEHDVESPEDMNAMLDIIRQRAQTPIPRGYFTPKPPAGPVEQHRPINLLAKTETRANALRGRDLKFLMTLDKAITQEIQKGRDVRSAIRSIMEKYGKEFPEPDPQTVFKEAYEKALQGIFSRYAESGPEEFAAQYLDKYGAKARPSLGPSAKSVKPSVTRKEGPVEAKPGGPWWTALTQHPGYTQSEPQELTMASRVPPTTVRPEQIPPGTEAQKVPPPPVPTLPEAKPVAPDLLPQQQQAIITQTRERLGLEDPYKGIVEPPKVTGGKGRVAYYTDKAPAFFIPRTKTLGPEARQRLPDAFRKAQNDVANEFVRTVKAIQATKNRSSTIADIYRTMDAAENDSRMRGGNSGKAIIVASGEALDPKLLDKWGYQFTKAFRKAQSDALDRRAAAKAMIATIKMNDETKQLYFDRRKLNMLEFWTKRGIAKANLLIMKGQAARGAGRYFEANQMLQKGQAWLEAANKLRNEITYARAHWNDATFRNTVNAVRGELGNQIVWENANGSNVKWREGYVPGRYEGEFFSDDGVAFGQGRKLGGAYRSPKRFQNYYEAISEDAYIPASYDTADIVQNRIAAGSRVVNRRLWLQAWKHVNDPHTGKPVAINADPIFEMRPHTDPTTGQTMDVPTLVGWKSTNPEYDVVYTGNGKQQAMAVRTGYKTAIETAMGHSQFFDEGVGAAALHMSQALKHGVLLMLDTFHPGRLFQYAAALGGKNWYDYRFGYQGGYSALNFRAQDIPAAVQQGLISPRAARWALGTIEVRQGKRTVQLTRQEVAQELIRSGLNAAKITDAMGREALRSIPIFGDLWGRTIAPFNKMVFDKITPGLMIESAVNNFERLNKGNPNIPITTLGKEVIRDVNAMYGNMGRQGIFRNPTFRDLSQTVLLAPFWFEGLLQKEARFYSRVSGLSYLAGRRLGPYTSSIYHGALGNAMLKGIAGYFVLTQLVNMITRHKFTWNNDEKGHEMDAWIPTGHYEGSGEETGFWVSPMSVFAETLHDYIRLGETKPAAWERIQQIGANKLGPIGRMMQIAASKETPEGYKITSTGSFLKEEGKQLMTPPISVTPVVRAIGHAVTPYIAPNRPGEFMQRMFTSAGIKSNLGRTINQQVFSMAQNFVKQNNLQPDTGWESIMTDEPSYSKLRAAIRNGDEGAAEKMLRALKTHRTDDQIIKAMAMSARRPLTGSARNEELFLLSLSPKELEMYHRAMMEKMINYQNFLQWYMSRD